ncbi:MAG: ribosome-associated translation inhibitor RaiA [Firmicutes bacterium]|nr:ribosome-associated translation inhibitor RaiA [Bacillota bacterium]
MKLQVHGDKVSVTPAIHAYIEEKLAKLDKYFEDPDNVTATVRVRVRNLEQIIEVTIPTKDFTLRREESDEDLYASIDLVVDKLERQIRKNKTRFERKYKDSSVAMVKYDFEADNNEVSDSKIVKRKEIDTKPMSEEEAILQAELLNHDFFVFKNINEDCVSVLYERKDGNYGIINVK